MKKVLIALGVVVAVVLTLALLLIGNINPIIKAGVEEGGPRVLHVPVKLDKVNISFFSGSGELQGFQIGNPTGYNTEFAINAERLKISLDVKSVTSDKIHIKEIILESPEICFEGDFQKNNLQQIQENVGGKKSSGKTGDQMTPKPGGETKNPVEGEKTPAQKETSAEAKPKKKVQIDYLKFENASVSVQIKGPIEKKFSLTMPTIELRDIGKNGETTPEDVAKLITEKIQSNILPAIKDEFVKLGGDLKNMGKEKMKEMENMGKEKMKEMEDKVKGLTPDKLKDKGLKDLNPFGK